MKKFILLLSLFLLAASCYSQLFKADEAGVRLFSIGTELIKTGDYKEADSILTLSLCSYKNENVYFNRALARLFSNDTVGFCQDVEMAASKYFDRQSEVMFDSLCCNKVDTIFYDKKRTISDKADFRYFEVVKYPKYDSLVYGSYHDKKTNVPTLSYDYGCENKILGINLLKTDVIAAYIIEKGIQYYYLSTKEPLVLNLTALDNLKEKAKSELAAKYSNLKHESFTGNIKVYFLVYIDKEGNIIKLKMEGLYPEINFDSDDLTELDRDIHNLVKEYPKISPAKFFDEKVRFMKIDFFEL